MTTKLFKTLLTILSIGLLIFSAACDSDTITEPELEGYDYGTLTVTGSDNSLYTPSFAPDTSIAVEGGGQYTGFLFSHGGDQQLLTVAFDPSTFAGTEIVAQTYSGGYWSVIGGGTPVSGLTVTNNASEYTMVFVDVTLVAQSGGMGNLIFNGTLTSTVD